MKNLFFLHRSFFLVMVFISPYILFAQTRGDFVEMSEYKKRGSPKINHQRVNQNLTARLPGELIVYCQETNYYTYKLTGINEEMEVLWAHEFEVESTHRIVGVYVINERLFLFEEAIDYPKKQTRLIAKEINKTDGKFRLEKVIGAHSRKKTKSINGMSSSRPIEQFKKEEGDDDVFMNDIPYKYHILFSPNKEKVLIYWFHTKLGSGLGMITTLLNENLKELVTDTILPKRRYKILGKQIDDNGNFYMLSTRNGSHDTTMNIEARAMVMLSIFPFKGEVRHIKLPLTTRHKYKNELLLKDNKPIVICNVEGAGKQSTFVLLTADLSSAEPDTLVAVPYRPIAEAYVEKVRTQMVYSGNNAFLPKECIVFPNGTFAIVLEQGGKDKSWSIGYAADIVQGTPSITSEVKVGSIMVLGFDATGNPIWNHFILKDKTFGLASYLETGHLTNAENNKLHLLAYARRSKKLDNKKKRALGCYTIDVVSGEMTTKYYYDEQHNIHFYNPYKIYLGEQNYLVLGSEIVAHYNDKGKARGKRLKHRLYHFDFK